MKIISVLDNLTKIKNKKVLLRLDLNAPLKKGKIVDDYKLKCALPTIKLLRKSGCSIIIVTHLGEPKLPLTKTTINQYSVKPLASWLSKKINIKINILNGDWKRINKLANSLARGDVVFLENIRFFKGELENSEILAKRLAALAQVYINDAFAVSHRNQASVSIIKDYLPTYAGPLLTSEIHNLAKIKSCPKPLVLIMGGAKLTTKLPLLKKLAPKASVVLTGGGMANTILKSQGFEIGQSLFDKEGARAYSRAKLNNVIVPLDVAVLNNKRRIEKDLKDVTGADNILDIGAKTIKLYDSYLIKAKTIVWNGPMGMFEKSAFAKGNQQLAKLVARATKRGVFTLVGGGETVAALNRNKTNFSWVSTGGGATLSYLEGKILPGLKKLIRY